MTKYENNCVMCGTYCIDCGRRNQAVKVCDICGSQEQLYRIDGDELCTSCIESLLKGVISEFFSDFFSECFDFLCEYYDIEEVKT